MAKPRVKVPKQITAGKPFIVKALIAHKMESGQRKDKKTGETIPRFIIKKFEAKMSDLTVFSADFAPAVSSNPYIAFYMKTDQSGELVLSCTDDANVTVSKTVKLNVT